MSLLLLILLLYAVIPAQESRSFNNEKVDGYKGIWFELGEEFEYGDKYSGGLGTYTAKHIPMAIYSPEVKKTFFVYGGTTAKEEKHLLCMIGCYNHKTNMVSKPTVVYDKINIDDPHDNPTIMIDNNGYVWVFVSGRANERPGIKLKSIDPYNINKFEIISKETFAYPQIWNTGKGYFHFFTKYTGERELYFEKSTDAYKWTVDKKLVGIIKEEIEQSGHYQVSCYNKEDSVLGTFFNRHVNGLVDARTDLYYIQTSDFGNSWQDINRNISNIPLTDVSIKERVIDYYSLNKNVYLKDMAFDKYGNPVCLYITSRGHEPGPTNAPHEWKVTFWNGTGWITIKICESNHNYDMGSLFIDDRIWKVVGPTENGPQKYGVGGEIAIWVSENSGYDWHKERDVTKNSKLNNSYVRRPLNAKEPFCYYWASGNPNKFSISELYFGDFEGNVWKLPYEMKNEFEEPIKVEFK